MTHGQITNLIAGFDSTKLAKKLGVTKTPHEVAVKNMGGRVMAMPGADHT